MAPVVVFRAVNESRSASQRSESKSPFSAFQPFKFSQPTNPNEGTGPKPLWTPEPGIPQRPGRDEVPDHSINPWRIGRKAPPARKPPDETTIRTPEQLD